MALNTTLPPWITQGGDAARNLALGAQVGSAIAQNSLARQRLALEAERMNQTAKQQEVLFPLKVTALKQELVANDLANKKAIDDRQQLLNGAQALTALTTDMQQEMQKEQPDYNRLNLQLLRLRQKYPAATGTPLDKAVEGFLQKSETSFKQRRALEQMRTSGAILDQSTIPNAAGGTDTFKKEQKPIPGMTPTRQTINGVTYETFDVQGGTEEDRAARAKAAGLEASGISVEGRMLYSRPRSGEEITVTTPDGTTVTRRVGGGQSPDALTTANKTRMQEESRKADLTMMALDKAAGAIRSSPDAIGVQGAVRELGEKLWGQLNPTESTSTRITDTREKARLAFQAIAESLRVDTGNMSKYELSQLEDAGKTLNLDEAPQTAMNKLQNLRNAVVARQISTLHSLGQPVPGTVLNRVPASEVSTMVSQGLMTVEESLRWYDLRK